MKLSEAKFCYNCDTIHNERKCPSCGSCDYWYLKLWLEREEKKVLIKHFNLVL